MAAFIHNWPKELEPFRSYLEYKTVKIQGKSVSGYLLVKPAGDELRQKIAEAVTKLDGHILLYDNKWFLNV